MRIAKHHGYLRARGGVENEGLDLGELGFAAGREGAGAYGVDKPDGASAGEGARSGWIRLGGAGSP